MILKPQILVVDDDDDICASLQLMLKRDDYSVKIATNPINALTSLTKNDISLVLLDMNFTIDTSGRQGIALLKKILEIKKNVPVILMTGWGSMELAIEGMKNGAKDFITKPWDNDRLLDSIRTALSLAASEKIKRVPKKSSVFTHIVGENDQIKEILETVEMVAPTDASVLILGESGTGKEVIAEAIHQHSGRNANPFVKVNLGGISNSLFESEMFGHVKGAFTDAHSDREGRFSLANKGTIFLDEIGDLQLQSQVKLLRVLQDNTYEILGSSITKKTDARIVAATNKNLQQMVFDQLFREDLFYRINLITVRLPPLRERQNDIPLLVNNFLEQMRKLYKRPNLEVSSQALFWLKNQLGPGNIRQLKNLIERTVLMSKVDILEKEMFESYLARSIVDKREIISKVGEQTLEEFEIELIKKAMIDFEGNISRVSRALGITRSSLYRRLEKYDIAHDH